MTIWKFSKKSFSKIVTVLGVIVSVCVSAQPLQLNLGLWEGINSKLGRYNILEIRADGEHKLFMANILTAFKYVQVLPFSDEQINCISSECIINVTGKNNEITRLIISPYLETSLKVMEINADADGVPIFTQTYQLDQTNGQSTVRTFINEYQHRIEALAEIQGEGIYGFWLGVLRINDKPELLSLEVYPDKKSYFTRYINGQNHVNNTSFLPENVKFDQDVIYITTEHPIFGNKLIINQLSNSQLGGYMYSIHKGQTLETGNFSLMRVK